MSMTPAAPLAWFPRCCRAIPKSDMSMTCAPSTSASPPRMPAARRDKRRVPLGGGARQCAQARLESGNYRPPATATSLRHHGARGPAAWRARRATSTGRRSSPPGSSTGKYPGDPRRQGGRRSGAQPVRRCARDVAQDRRRALLARQCGDDGQRTAKATDPGFDDEARSRPIATLHALLRRRLACAVRAAPMWRSPISSRRAPAALPIISERLR